MKLRHLPNLITGLRLAMAPLLPWLMVAGHWHAALAVVVVAAGSDLLDGFLARRYDWKSRVGGLLDPLADKLLVAAAFSGLWLAAILPGWMPLLVIGRDLLIVAGAGVWWRMQRTLDAEPSWLGKITTLVQLATILYFVAAQARLVQLAADDHYRVGLQLFAAVTVLTLLSGIDYVFRYGAKAWLFTRNRKQ